MKTITFLLNRETFMCVTWAKVKMKVQASRFSIFFYAGVRLQNDYSECCITFVWAIDGL